MTKDEIIKAICHEFNIEITDSIKEAMSRVFSAGWRSGETFAKQINPTNSQMKKIRISDLLRAIDSDASVLTQKFFQQCAYVRKDGEIYDYEDVEVKRITAMAYNSVQVRDGKEADTYYLHID